MVAERRILVVDDDPDVRKSCERVFGNHGYDVETSGSAASFGAPGFPKASS